MFSDMKAKMQQMGHDAKSRVYKALHHHHSLVHLNGYFDLTIHEARNLPKTDGFGLQAGDFYVAVKDNRGRLLAKTNFITKECNPVWEAKFQLAVVDCTCIIFEIMDSDVSSDELVTKLVLNADEDLNDLLHGKPISRWFQLGVNRSEIRISIASLSSSTGGLLELHHSRFPVHKGCRVTLFQSAHVGNSAGLLPSASIYNASKPGGHKRMYSHPTQPFMMDDNATAMPRPYVHRNLWEELYVAILEAKHFIYIVGWSVNVEITLLRERNVAVPGYEDLDGTKVSVGELLKRKADEGVCVCLMLWREATSYEGIMGSNTGIVGTFSEQTKSFFTGTKVHCRSLMRRGNQLCELYYTHHQKYVCCDAPPLDGTGPRRLMGFIGGVDITKGRFDTPTKDLYGTLGTWHSNDFYQNCFDADPTEGPRQPWQDIHSKVEGSIVRDLITNFEQRWLKQTTAERSHGLLYNMDNPDILPADQDKVMSADHPESWNVQFFRSIDANSIVGCNGVEGGIHHAYEEAISKAERFLYFENQYFMGGSQHWDESVLDDKKNMFSKFKEMVLGQETQAVNRIPVLIIARIVRAIQERKRFAVYVCIPLFPEGLPESKPIQEILYWQYRTMEMMYKIIAKTLHDEGVTAHPCDYLNFFCLGNREPSSYAPPSGRLRKNLVNQSRRHMIYVHSKLLVADDDYVIVGSANINDRSMAGDRDTESCIGAYQPHQSREKGVKYPNGHIQAFRLSLWGEHLALRSLDGPASALYYPESKECIDFINARASQSWREHADPSPQPQTCHLMKYPVFVNPTGTLQPVQKEIPDAPGAKITGRDSRSVPDFMTS